MRLHLMNTLLLFAVSVGQLLAGNEQVKSIQLYPKGNEVGMPVLQLNQSNRLVLEFDYLGEDAPYFNYKIEHFNADWERSKINPLQFIKGFNTGSVNDFEFSFDTNQLYTHYEFEFPNEQLSFKISGNYKISVFEEDSDDILFSERFYITEQAVSFNGAIKNSSGIGTLESHHQIEFSVNYQGLPSNSPRQEFQANVMQNNRTDNALIHIEPQRFTDDQLFFTNPFKQSFAAGNEFRWFNIKSTRYLTDQVADVIEKNGKQHVYLIPDLPRVKSDFLQFKDFNGEYVIDFQEGTRPDLEGDYVYVHFTLKENESLKGKDIFVYGALTNWEIKEENKLEMNPRQNLLETTLYLKQGNYDYMYVTKDGERISTELTEGNFYRTENVYTVFIYYQPFSARYERLVGIQQFDSRF